ncbi:MAG: acetylxylan esterase, partial [Lentisphaeria bacterium]|nr:acetylxylan esterase [Lentisphaeria bacterium]
LVEPEKLLPGMDEPADFDAFWKSQRTRLDKVPLKAKLTQVKAAGKWRSKYNLYDIKIDCAGSAPVSGYLSVPVNAKPKSLPAMVTYHGAGVYTSTPRYNAVPALLLDVNAHGVLNGQPKEYYVKLSQTTLKGYPHFNKNDREKIYFNGMYLRVMRALDYIKSRPEWNGKVLIVAGSSQGGGQAIAAAALDQQVTLCLAAVPALSDHAGSTAKPVRMPGWPRFYDARHTKNVNKKIVSTAAYYDNVNFAKRIKCEAWLTAGLIDTVCSPAGIHVVFNNLKSAKKYLNVSPTGHHGGAPNTKGFARANQILSGKK